MFLVPLWLAVWLTPAASGFERMYAPAQIEADAKRLSVAVQKIYQLGLAPGLTAGERNKLGEVIFRFPKSKRGDDLMNFYAYRDGDRSIVVMPLLSLKALEDLATARAWLQINHRSHQTIDIYYAMLRHRPVYMFKGKRYPDLLTALAIPKDAYKQKGVDSLSLRFRNEAFAFIIAHELAHALFRHKGYGEITKAQAREDEIAADRFALDLLNRVGSTPMGGFLFFQAQVYRFRHRAEFPTSKAWTDYLMKVATHPMSVDRLRAFGRFTAGPLAASRPRDRLTFAFIGAGMEKIATWLEDEADQACMALAARKLPLSALKPGPAGGADVRNAVCRAPR